MIRLYSGTPGSGKSLHTARDILWRCRFGEPVIANFPVAVDERRYPRQQCFYWDNQKMCPEWLIKFSREWFKNHKFREGAILLIIDECQLLFNAREWQKTGRADWLSFFTQHRKYGFDICLVAQFDRMVDRQIRSLIEYEYIHRKVSNFGFGGRCISLLLGGHAFVAVKMWYPLNEKIDSEFIRATKKYYSIYNTYDTFGSSPAAAPVAGGDSGAPPKQPAPLPAVETDKENVGVNTVAKVRKIPSSPPKKGFGAFFSYY